ncbi:uncharacterized protein LOC144444211 [Glandiceps talaboti]
MDDSSVVIETFEDCSNKPNQFVTTTVIIVIDASKYIHRSDISIEWGDVEILQQHTNPAGSFLLVIYGDKLSKCIKDNSLLAAEWFDIWKNKDLLRVLVKNGRCFTIFDKFNERQHNKFRDYLSNAHLLPFTKRGLNIIVFGNKDHDVYRQYMKEHPFLVQYRSYDYENYRVEEYCHFLYLRTGSTNPTRSIRLYYICNSDLQICEQFDLSNFEFEFQKYLRELSTYTLLPPIHRVILLCHCKKCFLLYENEAEQIKMSVLKTLDTIGTSCRPENVHQFISIRGADGLETNIHQATMMLANRYNSMAKSSELASVLSQMPMDALLKFYTWCICPTPGYINKNLVEDIQERGLAITKAIA